MVKLRRTEIENITIERSFRFLGPEIGERGLIVLAIGIAAGGMAMNWGWLVAVGIAPILLVIIPCAAMCALGLCMNKGGSKSCSSGNDTTAKGADFKEGSDRGA